MAGTQNPQLEEPIYIETLLQQRRRWVMATNGDGINRYPVRLEEIWNEYSLIPNVPDPTLLLNGDTAGVVALRKLRFKERVLESEGEWDSADEYVEQVRVLTRGAWQIWRRKKDAKGKEGEWELYKEGDSSLSVIPAVFFRPGDHNGDVAAFPALEDLAHLNRRHWQANVEQVDLMSWVRRPAWVGRMLVNEGEQVAFGPGRMLHATSPEADLKSVGVDAGSVEAGRQELKDLEERMALFGLQLLMPKTGSMTATQHAREGSENDSTLKSWALALKDCLEQAMTYAAMWVDIQPDEAPSIAVNTEFNVLADASPELILTAVREGIIPREMAFGEFVRRGVLPDDKTWSEAQSMLENESRQQPGPSFQDAGRQLLGNQVAEA